MRTGLNRSCVAGCAGSLVVLALAGCDDAEIRRYQVPRVETPQTATASSERVPQRLLAAIVPRGEQTWFFKLMGPDEAVAKEKGAFDEFIQSVRFAESKPTWSVPEGWTEQPGSELRFATLKLGDEGKLELTVIPLGGSSGSVLANVNRWRGQIGLGPISEAELGSLTKTVAIGDDSATVVEMSGPGGGTGSMMPPFASRASESARPSTNAGHRDDLKYAMPPGWRKGTDPSGMSVAALEVGEGDATAKVTIMPLPGQAGGFVANVNRWRGQVGLEPATEEQIQKETEVIEVAGDRAAYIDIAGSGDGANRILGVAAEHAGQTWFIKMIGPSDVVAKEKPAFEAFVRSVRYH